jgi:GSH-dependent disulfide-bond oxidoreductase
LIDLHYWPTPNGKKVTILLEELGMPYDIVPCNIGKGDQSEPEFLKISPNNRMPALVDHAPADGGPTISVFEPGAIMMYLAEKAGRFLRASAQPHPERHSDAAARTLGHTEPRARATCIQSQDAWL